MTEYQRLKNLEVPKGKIDVVLDTDTFNEIDDQYAVSYLIRSDEKLNTVALYAAPFYGNGKSENPKDGMEKSYDELIKVLGLLGAEKPVFKGSENYLPDENTPVVSDAATDLAARAMNYSPEKPLYVVAIGAITNVASALLINPKIAENIVVVWLGGHAHHCTTGGEFNMCQDIAAARVIIKSKVPYVQLPCGGVVSSFTISKPEIESWLIGKGELATYLGTITIEEAEIYAKIKTWTRVIWDVTAVAWLLNDDNKFMQSRIIPAPLPSYENLYTQNPDGHFMCYVYSINRDGLMNDLINKITGI